MTREERWATDPIAFISEALINPETGKPFELYPVQVQWLREALTARADGTLPYAELVYSAPKKSGKTATAAMVVLYVVVVLGGPYAEGYILANDLDQAAGRVFTAITRIVEASPLLRRRAKVTSNQIVFTSTGSTITAIASDYAGAAGSNPTIAAFDELWGYVSERSQRLWDEMIPVPTRKVSVRLTTTYAGFEGESKLLEDLYARGLAGEPIAPAMYRASDLLMLWAHDPIAPWQTEAWLEQMRRTLRPHAFVRMVQNRFVTGEEQFIPVEWWDRAAHDRRMNLVSDRNLAVVLGVDAGLKRDSAAVVACSFEAGKVRLVDHRIFTPKHGETLDLEETLEATIRDFAGRFRVREVRFDPWQFQRSAQGLTKAGLPMREWPQSIPNLTSMSTNLFELLKEDNLRAYPNAEIRLATQRAVAVETGRGLKIAKEKASHKIDVIVALAMAALAAVESSGHRESLIVAPVSILRTSTWLGEGRDPDELAVAAAASRPFSQATRGAVDTEGPDLESKASGGVSAGSVCAHVDRDGFVCGGEAFDNGNCVRCGSEHATSTRPLWDGRTVSAVIAYRRGLPR